MSEVKQGQYFVIDQKDWADLVMNYLVAEGAIPVLPEGQVITYEFLKGSHLQVIIRDAEKFDHA